MAEVGVAQFRRELKAWLDRVQAGQEVVVTDRGRPIARLTGAEVPLRLHQLIAEGKIAEPTRLRQRAGGRSRVRSQGGVSQLVVAERDTRRS